MGSTGIDDEVLAVVRRHWVAVHGEQITDAEIATKKRSGPVASGVRVVVRPETIDSPSWFECLGCPEGARSYRVDVGADPLNPPSRHLAMIARHLEAEHGITDPAGRIYRGTASQEVVCGYVSATPIRPAWFDCALCATGQSRHFLDDPPYGDARAPWHLRIYYRDFANQIARLSPAERVIQWEAHQRGVLAKATQRAVATAVREARKAVTRRKLTPTQMGIQAVVLARVRAGAPVTTVIRELSVLAHTDPNEYAVLVAEQIPAMADSLDQPAELVADSLGSWYGPPARTERAIWAIWMRLPDQVRHRLEATDEDL